MRKRKGDKIDGILLIDKPGGITSHIACQRFKHLLQANKAGHTGSLDPLATGMLPLCFGEATKLCHYLLEEDKCYQVMMQLGVKTTTGDSEGEVLVTKKVPLLSREEINTALSLFKGKIFQIPPMYSAVKHQGQPLYRLARKGKSVERAAREIMIHHLTLDDFDSAQNTISLTVECSKGTYIRTLVEDIGMHLGCGAHVSFLRRLWVSTFKKAYRDNKMIQLDAFSALPLTERRALLLSMHEVLALFFPTVTLSSEIARLISRGQAVQIDLSYPLGLISMCSESGEYLGIGEWCENGQLAPKRLVAVAE